MNPKTPFGITIFCDDIREEVTQKLTLVGVYNHVLGIAGGFPTILPRLCMLIRYFDDLTALPENLKLIVYMPGDTDEPSIVSDLAPRSARIDEDHLYDEDGDIKMATMQIPLSLSPVQLTGPGAIKVRMIRDGETIKLGRLDVVHESDIPPVIA